MYRCGNKVEIGDCVTVNVSVMVTEMNVLDGSVAIVLEAIHEWAGISSKSPLLTLKFPDDTIQQLPASWCMLCQRK